MVPKAYIFVEIEDLYLNIKITNIIHELFELGNIHKYKTFGNHLELANQLTPQELVI